MLNLTRQLSNYSVSVQQGSIYENYILTLTVLGMECLSVEVLLYKSKRGGFDSRWSNREFPVT